VAPLTVFQARSISDVDTAVVVNVGAAGGAGACVVALWELAKVVPDALAAPTLKEYVVPALKPVTWSLVLVLLRLAICVQVLPSAHRPGNSWPPDTVFQARLICDVETAVSVNVGAAGGPAAAWVVALLEPAMVVPAVLAAPTSRSRSCWRSTR